MNIDADLLSSPLYIIKKLQRNSFREEASAIKGRVLDIGCGQMPYRRHVSCDEYVGIDSFSGTRPNLAAEADKLPFKDGSFDCVICTEVLEHLAVPSDCIAEVKRVLKDGGRVYITVPQSWPLHYAPYDYLRFTEYGLVRIMAANGFKVVNIKRIGGAFTQIGQEIIESTWTLMVRSLSFIGPVWAERISTGLLIPLSVSIYLFGLIADRIEKRYALGWAMVAVK